MILDIFNDRRQISLLKMNLWKDYAIKSINYIFLNFIITRYSLRITKSNWVIDEFVSFSTINSLRPLLWKFAFFVTLNKTLFQLVLFYMFLFVFDTYVYNLCIL